MIKNNEINNPIIKGFSIKNPKSNTKCKKEK